MADSVTSSARQRLIPRHAAAGATLEIVTAAQGHTLREVGLEPSDLVSLSETCQLKTENLRTVRPNMI